jgi:hypothetical protein
MFPNVSIHVGKMFDVHMVGLKTVPMNIIFPNMSIHVVTMFAMFIMSIQAITIEIE